MLRLLRKINLQKSDGENSATFLAYAIGEFVLVFLGILIALQVDNWNQNRKERELERILLTEMLTNLKGDLEDIEYNMRLQRHFQNSNQVVLDFLQNELPWHDSLGRHFKRLAGRALFDVNTSAYEKARESVIELIAEIETELD